MSLGLLIIAAQTAQAAEPMGPINLSNLGSNEEIQPLKLH